LLKFLTDKIILTINRKSPFTYLLESPEVFFLP